ncbi:hypothetical protein [Sphingomonas profundi]|uniref:hypothetical protein n=1 Tax=Alterirhizorhabdus profundi TaxID=2681549 RepID=UPI0012E7AB68|nr:hypothetical protein [Sphingomonas profundi]
MNGGALVDVAAGLVPGGGWVRTALRIAGKAWPYVAIAVLGVALLLTRGTLDRVKAEGRAAIADIGRASAERAAADARRGEAAASTYAARTAALQPIILRSKDTVTTYAQTPAGRTPCLAADRVHGLDELDRDLFTPPDPAGAARALHADPGAPPAGRIVDQR